MSSLVLPCLGLAPDAHALAAPKGAMRVADNVVCDLPGIVRARPSFEKGTQKTAARKPVSMCVYGSTRILVSKDGSTYTLESEAAAISGNADPVSFDAAETSFAQARGSLYYCTSTGVRALRTEAGTTTDAAGMDVPAFGLIWRGPFRDTVWGPFTGPFAVAYCLVVKRTDAAGAIHRSIPTPRIEFRSGAGPADDSMILFDGTVANEKYAQWSTGQMVAGDEVEVYRTTIAATQDAVLPSEMYLVTSYVVTAADIVSARFPPTGMVVRDMVDDADLGETLYTAASREGALNAKYSPPLARQIALWSSCMWFGYTQDRHRITLRIRAGHESSTGQSYSGGNSTYGAIGHTLTTGDIASGTNTILNVVDITGVVVGSYVAVGAGGSASDNPFDNPVSGGIPRLTKVTAIVGAGPYTVTISNNATATVVGEGLVFGDHVTIDGAEFASWSGVDTVPFTSPQRSFSNRSPTYSGQDTAPNTPTGRAEAAALSLAAAINDAARAGVVAVRATAVGDAITIERWDLGGALWNTAFTVKSLKPQAFIPSLGDDSSDTLSSTQETHANRVYYSRPDEPEAVPLLNYIDVGSQLYPIQRLVPLTDALLVFKQDGLFRITGSAPGNWSVDCCDQELRLVRPEAAEALGGVCFAWTNRGVMAITAFGEPRSISAGKIDAALFSTQGAVLANSQYHGCRVLVSQRHQLVLLTMPSTSYAAPRYFSDTVYVFSVKTGAWTTWPLRIRCGATGSDGVLWTAVTNALDELEWETRYLLDTPRGYDRNYVLGAGSGAPSAWTETASSTAMSITNAQRNEWVPAVGDWVHWTIGSTYYRRIIAVVDAGGGDYSWTLDSAAPANIGSATAKGALVGSPVVLEWLQSAQGNAGAALMVNRTVAFTMDQEAQVKVSPTDFRVTLSVRHDGSAALASVTGTPLRSTVAMRPYRMGYPRNAARMTDQGPRLSWSEIDWPWRLAGIVIAGEAGSDRVRK